MIIHYRLLKKDFEKVVTPGSFVYAMRRFVVGENDEFRGGFGQFKKEKKQVVTDIAFRPMWFAEFFVGIEGKGRVTGYSPPNYDNKEVYDMEPGDALFMGKGTLRKIEAISDEWIIFYVAIPSSEKDLQYKIFPSSEHWLEEDKVEYKPRKS